jgi:ubiquinone/menaquinone biosynthesis C-methylase UbiE
MPGVDMSDTMVHEARENNRALIDEGRVKLRLATVDRLPFPNAAFDRALIVNTIYFWPDQLSGLAESRRVLRDDGFLVLASMTPETSAKSPTAA